MLCRPFMRCTRLVPVGLAATVSLVVCQASAQPAPATPPAAEPAPAPVPPPTAAAPDTLEMPYNEPAATAPAPAATPPAAPPRARIDLDTEPVPDIRPRLPIRAQRRLALTGEVGWNGLAGFGPVLTYYAHPHVALDLGLGFSLLGGKAGLRTRYLFLKSPITPFIGVGFNATSGFGEATTDPKSDPQGDPTRDPATVNVGASYLVQGVIGIDYIHRRGFTLIASGGWAHLLNKNNYQVLDGELTEDEERGFNIAFKGGLVLSASMGYAFE